MKVYGIDASVLTRKKITGTEKYTLELLREMMKKPLLKNEKVFLYTPKHIEILPRLPAGWEEKILKWPMKRGWTNGRLVFELLFRTPNVFFTPAHEIPIVHSRVKIVSTVHDLAFYKTPESYSYKQIKRQKNVLDRAIKRSDKIITISNTTKKDLIKLKSVNERLIEVIYLAVKKDDYNIEECSVLEILKKYNLERLKYFISVGRIEKKKNIDVLVQAFKNFNKDYSLVLVGSKQDEEYLKDEISENENIKLLGYVDDNDIAGLLKGAIAYLFPSNYEGFGLTSLEAMASNLPLIISDTPALLEIVDDAGIVVGVHDVFGWRKSMNEIISNEEQRFDLIRAGRVRLENFSWSDTAEKTWSILRGV